MNKRIIFLLLAYTLAASHNATRLVDLVERMKFILLEKIELSDDLKLIAESMKKQNKE